MSSERPPRQFIDTNVLIRFMADEDEDKAARGLALLAKVKQGDLRPATSTMVIFETAFGAPPPVPG